MFRFSDRSEDAYREIVECALTEYAEIPFAYGDIHTEAVFDRTRDRYLLVNVGWDRGERVHYTLVHVDILDGKLWIQCDNSEHGFANDFVRAGLPKDRIVLGFRSPELRKHTEFAA